ncbi:MAG: F0F1 ATP synthase subunit A [Candidatus Eremiobacteraeota bacterium]|nr:F0F1 ATP synthase subunit A [Candidatus Eremiobacteraeota bacterium]
MHEEVGSHLTWHWPLIGSVHADTILTTWLVMLVSLAFFWYIGNSYRSNRVNKRQATFEGIVNYLADLTTSTIGKHGERFVPIFIGMFFFIFILNQIGFFPFKQLGLPFGGSPTADLNTTVAFALLVFFGIQFVAVRQNGIKAYAHLFKPFPVLFPLNVIEETARPVVLALRLFFNIFVGELLLFVVATIIASNVKVGPVNLSLGAAVVPFLLQFFNFFVGTLQAFVFTLLSIVYLSLATAEEH